MNNFQELGLDEHILQALNDLGISKPTEIQQEAIPYLLSSTNDFIGLAQTGTGKTAAFGLPLLQLIEEDSNYCQAIVLSPTRELAQQISEGLKSFSKYSKKLKIECVYGGAPIMTQLRNLKSKPQVIVATPGRLVDLIKRKAVDVTKLRYLVLDEADEMLNMGFKEELNTILLQTPDEKSTWLFSATMPKLIRKIVADYMHNPHEISVKSGVEVNKNIAHQYMIVKVSDKLEAVKRFMDMEGDLYGVMFCRTKIDTQNIADELSRAGYAAEALHGDLSQNQRDLVMKKFKDHAINLLVATDVAARGIDVNDLTHVIHHKLPDELEFYTHRSGRTARAGKKGVSVALVSKAEQRRLGQIENILGIEFEKVLVPSGDAIVSKRIDSWSASIIAQEIKTNLPDGFRDKVHADLAELTKEELIDKLMTIEFNKLNLTDTRDLNSSAHSKSDRSDRSEGRGTRDRDGGGRSEERRSTRTSSSHVKFTINLGKIDSISKSDILSIISEVTGVAGADIGRIETQQKKTILEISKANSSDFTGKFTGFEFDNREIKVAEGGEFTEPKGGAREGRDSRGRGGRPDRRKSYGAKGGGSSKPRRR
ncbi:DEAD/DEAH box helicase [Reichenbachiella agarivorans]|uniref:RNA helicase n=1 Tax=Reichenbachiella agarivorans TaxID=2979464 RepID=A0ABY6CM12_9BACT|nr:DEAD/DEAH box helicase [Reichenbachiella agarivorans]UXP31554.1 DEAD/DEAH box helicase [Reichenbachiella agarivorans]